MDVSLEGANAAAVAIPGERSADYERYYLPQCPNGVTAARYGKITYANVYPNIDWVLYVNDNELKYDFVVRAGGDPKQIKLKYEGTTSLSIQEGNILAETPFGSVTDHSPYSYVAESGKTVASNFIQSAHTVSFNVGNYSGTLVIDPAVSLKWDTYFGGALEDSAHYVKADPFGHVYLCGTTISTNNIATSGAFLTSVIGSQDGYLAKFDKTGNRLWSTYLGGTEGDLIAALSTDLDGNVYCGGVTSSETGLATPGAHKTTSASYWGSHWPDLFIVKLDSTGARTWGTYYGGEYGEGIGQFACDLTGNLYVLGQSYSDTGIATPGAFHTVRYGYMTAFLVKFNSQGIRQWGTYFGGDNVTYSHSIDISPIGDIVIGGSTNSDSAIASPGADQTFRLEHGLPSPHDGYVAKFDPAGHRLWSTYIGGTGYDIAYSVAFDATGNVFAAGRASDDTLIATPGTYSTNYQTGFLIKYDPTGKKLWGTYYPLITGVDCDIAGNAYVTTIGNSVTLAKFNNAGMRTDSFGLAIKKCDFYEGINYDPITKTLYTASSVGTTTFATTAGAYQTTYGGGASDAFLIAWKVDTLVTGSVGIVNNIKTLTLYPNPNKGSFTFKADFSGNEQTRAKIEIVNLMGTTVYKHEEDVVNNSLNKQIKLDAPAGIYLLRINYGAQTSSLKFIVE